MSSLIIAQSVCGLFCVFICLFVGYIIYNKITNNPILGGIDKLFNKSRPADKKPCASGLRDDGTSCWNDAHIYGKGCCNTVFKKCGGCKDGYHDDGCTCRKTGVGIKTTAFQRYTCRDDETLKGALCYKK